MAPSDLIADGTPEMPKWFEKIARVDGGAAYPLDLRLNLVRKSPIIIFYFDGLTQS